MNVDHFMTLGENSTSPGVKSLPQAALMVPLPSSPGAAFPYRRSWRLGLLKLVVRRVDSNPKFFPGREWVIVSVRGEESRRVVETHSNAIPSETG
jgi:hypothetical protein